MVTFVGQMTDIDYDSKFYITVVAAITGAILVGVFVTHAFVVYYSKKKAAESSKFVFIFLSNRFLVNFKA